MTTPIGQALRESRRKLFLAALLGGAITLCDLALSWHGQYMTPYRLGFLLVAVAAYGSLTRWDSASLGLVFRPIQGYAYWFKTTVLIGLLMLGFLVATALVYRAFGTGLHVYQRPPSEILPWFYYACINVPILEEVVYRFILCVPATALARPLGAVVLSGTVFAGLHIATGVASPDNLIAGYILAWAYLKSGSLFIPVTLHALGNLSVLIAEVAAWHWG